MKLIGTCRVNAATPAIRAVCASQEHMPVGPARQIGALGETGHRDEKLSRPENSDSDPDYDPDFMGNLATLEAAVSAFLADPYAGA